MGVMVLPVGRSRIQIVCSRAIAHAMQWNHILAQGEMTAQSSVKQLYFLGQKVWHVTCLDPRKMLASHTNYC
jgi:hypothetical protein